jgi:nucleotide-binding universal stress UspA family protein
MALPDLLVLADRTPSSAARLDLAIGYARRHGALVKGVAFPTGPGAGDEMETARLFAERTKAAGVPSAWIDIESARGRGFASVVQEAHHSRLVVAGQAPERGGHPELAELPERLVLETGRPVLTVPYAGTFDRFGERVLIAWNDGRESTRAIHDAFPVLRAARKVHLVKVITEADALRGAERRLAEIVAYLERAGVRCRGELVLSIDFPSGDRILNRAAEEGSDLLVMGAYGRAGGGKPVLGPVAKHILRHMTLPVMMSH